MKNVERNIERNGKKQFITIFIISSFIILIFAIIFSKQILAVDEEKKEDFIVHKNQNPVNLDKIIEENLQTKKKEELTIEEVDLDYTTVYRNNSQLPSGTIQVVQEGRNGKQNVVIIKKYEDENVSSEEIVANNLTKTSINKIVEIGTGSGKNNYKPTVGNLVYVTSNILAVKSEPNIESEKKFTLKKDNEVKILKIENDWLYINSSEGKGYIPKDCITNINPNKEEIVYDENEYSKNELTKNISFDMDLNQKSSLSLSQFEKILSGNSQDINSVIEQNAKYFYYAEQQYNINGVFLAAVAIHESGWATSTIANNKKNLFGYGAYDSNPYGGAYSFSTYAESIDLLARVFKKYYLNPEGTSIYAGDVATGRFYSGKTLSAVNIKYASDKNWANSVYKWIQYLYNRL